MLETLQETVRYLRLGRTGAGNAALGRLVEQLAPHLEQGLGNRPKQLLPLLQAIVVAQQAGDYLAVADRLEYELAPRLWPEAAAQQGPKGNKT